jgi:hypothetical protein
MMTHFFQCVQTSVFYYFFVQEVVGALVTHVGSGFPNEADSSLDVLSDLVQHHPSYMSSFAIFLKVRVKNISPQLYNRKYNRKSVCTDKVLDLRIALPNQCK